MHGNKSGHSHGEHLWTAEQTYRGTRWSFIALADLEWNCDLVASAEAEFKAPSCSRLKAIAPQGTQGYTEGHGEMRMKTVFVASMLALVFAAASNLSGKWSGSFKVDGGDQHNVPQLFILKQQGNALTGSGGPNAGEQYPIEHGRVDGDAVQFDLTTGEWKFTYQLKSTEADSLNGTIKLESPDESRKAKVSLARVK